jgi:serine/threonine protein kinase
VCRLHSAKGMADFGPRCCNRCPKDFASIVHDCLQKDPDARPKAKEIVDRLINVIADQQASS